MRLPINLLWEFALLAIGSYLIGNINFAVIISKLKKQDIRKMGSGNPGTLNMSRNFGIKIGLLTLVLDMLKGVVPTLVGYLIYRNVEFVSSNMPISLMARVFCGFFVVLGHVFPVFMRFKGGKGIATTIGVFMVCNWWVGIICGVLAIVFIMFTEIGSMGSFIATTPAAIAELYNVYSEYVAQGAGGIVGQITVVAIANLAIVGIVFLTWYAHRKNIQRLIAGEEHPTNWYQMIREKSIKKKAKKNKEENK